MRTEIKKLTNKIIEKFNTNNPFEIAFMLGIYTYYAELPVKTNGFSFVNDEFNFICINEELNDSMRLFTCAHELAHLIMHKELNAFEIGKNTLAIAGKYEKQADTFAALLLLNDVQVNEDEQLTISNISTIYGIPERAVRLKYGIE